MSDYIIFTDSGCDIPQRELTKLGIRSVDLTFVFDGEDHIYRNSDMPIDKFYARMRSGQSAKTSGVNADVFLSAFTPLLREGHDILYIGFSSALSCTYQAAVFVAEELRVEFPERKIITIDPLCASVGLGLLLYMVNRKRLSGASIEETADYTRTIMGSICHWFTVDDLIYLKRGGRVSATAAVVGQILGIKPVLHVDDLGHLVPVTKVRGRKISVKALAGKYEQLAVKEYETVFIGHSDCMADALFLRELVYEINPGAHVHIFPIGPVIGAHSGPGTLALFFVGQKR